MNPFADATSATSRCYTASAAACDLLLNTTKSELRGLGLLRPLQLQLSGLSHFRNSVSALREG